MTDQDHSTATGPGGSPLRASDSDRESVAERLRRHHGDGRLDTEELQERIERCYQAKTVGELDQLLADLPPEQNAVKRGDWRRTWLIAPVPLIIGLLAICAVAGRHAAWLAIPLLFLTLRLFVFGRRRLFTRTST